MTFLICAVILLVLTHTFYLFQFYDSAPQELFNKIKTAEFSIPDDGRVSEDTKSVIKRLLVTEPERRLTAVQVCIKIKSVTNSLHGFGGADLPRVDLG